MKRRSVVLLLALALLAVLIALPAFAASPSPGPGKSENARGKDKTPKTPVTLTGTVGTAKDADGATIYTLRSGGTTYTLEAGPPWFHGDKHPLKAYVGKSVRIVGEKSSESNEVDVESVDGKALREAGKPPWAGGWKVVGKSHPGWSAEKAERFKDKFGDCFPPGKCKQKPGATAAP
jgi:hypothetical protein